MVLKLKFIKCHPTERKSVAYKIRNLKNWKIQKIQNQRISFSRGFPLPFNVETLQAFGALFQIPQYYRKFLYYKTKILCNYVIIIKYFVQKFKYNKVNTYFIVSPLASMTIWSVLGIDRTVHCTQSIDICPHMYPRYFELILDGFEARSYY
jgi:hypothetical protein